MLFRGAFCILSEQGLDRSRCHVASLFPAHNKTIFQKKKEKNLFLLFTFFREGWGQLRQTQELPKHRCGFPGALLYRHISTGRKRRFQEISDQIEALLKGMIDKRKEAMQAGEAAKADLLGILFLNCQFERNTTRCCY